MKKITNRDNAVFSMLSGIGIAVLICLGMTAVLAQLLLTEKIGEGSTELLMTVLLLISSVLGTMFGARLRGEQQLITIVVITALLITLMFLGAMLADGRFSHTLMRLGAVIGGGAISCVLCLKRTAKPIRRKKRYR